MISKACKYGIRATIFVASKAGEGIKLNVKEIAREVDAPEAFTAKILQILNRHKVITSLKGPYGGFSVEKKQLDQPVINIVAAIDGMGIFKECGLGLKDCSDAHPCPMHHKYKIAREAVRTAFEHTTVGHLAENLNNGSYFLNSLGYLNVGEHSTSRAMPARCRRTAEPVPAKEPGQAGHD